MPSVLLIGTGRMAYHLGHAMRQANVPLVGIAGRNNERAAELARFLERPALHWDRPFPEADIILIATSDDSIGEVAARLPQSKAVVAHTAGAVGIDVLLPHAKRGALWPVQTLSHGAPMDLSDVPLIVDANTEEARAMMLKLARSISGSVFELTPEQRETMHLAAVLTSNFPVYLVSEAMRLLKEQKLPPQLLMPLWRTTAAKVSTIGPEQALTGPARRGDMSSIKRHLELLADDADLHRAYALLSTMVLKAHGHGTDGIDL